jgi:hypothetical protein
LYVEYSTFQENTAASQGGAIDQVCDSQGATFKSDNFLNNSAIGGGAGNGGAIFLEIDPAVGNVLMDACTFSLHFLTKPE